GFARPRALHPNDRTEDDQTTARHPRSDGPVRPVCAEECSSQSHSPRLSQASRPTLRADPLHAERPVQHRRRRCTVWSRRDFPEPLSFRPNRVDRIQLGRLNCRIQCRERRDQQARDDNQYHVARLRCHRKMIYEIYRWVQLDELVSVQCKRTRKTEHETEPRAHGADDETLYKEDVSDRRRRESHRLEDTDLARLVVHHHRQRAHYVERRHYDDQQQDDTHSELLQLERLEQRMVLLLPID